MCRQIIHSWRILSHCIIFTSGWHLLPFHYHSNCICRRPHYVCFGNSKCLWENHFIQLCKRSLSKVTISISGLVQNKMAKTYISLQKTERNMHLGNKIYPRNKKCCKILVWITKFNLHHYKNDQKVFTSTLKSAMKYRHMSFTTTINLRQVPSYTNILSYHS